MFSLYVHVRCIYILIKITAIYFRKPVSGCKTKETKDTMGNGALALPKIRYIEETDVQPNPLTPSGI